LLVGKGGTKMYQAPEVLKKVSYDEKGDIWSIGHIFYLLLTFAHPFDNEH
jgi:serine/threonine protein kinase